MRWILPAMIRVSAAVGMITGGILLGGCDLASPGELVSASNTVVLNANSPITPVMRHRFEYTRSDTTGEGGIETVSHPQMETLETVLTENGFRRSDVVSAKVDSVVVERIHTNALSKARLHLGTGTDRSLIANVQFESGTGALPARDETRTDVTRAVKAGGPAVSAQFSIDDPDRIPPGGGRVRAIVYYQLEVEGV